MHETFEMAQYSNHYRLVYFGIELPFLGESNRYFGIKLPFMKESDRFW